MVKAFNIPLPKSGEGNRSEEIEEKDQKSATPRRLGKEFTKGATEGTSFSGKKNVIGKKKPQQKS